MKVLVACESSGATRDAFRALGHDAWSCDLLPADTDPTFHIQGDCLPVIAQGWDLVIGHPPCTHLASSGAKWWKAKREDGRQAQGIALFMSMVDLCEKHAKAYALENPVGIMSTVYKKPTQIIQPWQFGHGEMKTTCLWTKNLPLLVPTNIVEGREQKIWKMSPGPLRWKMRSKTYEGIARAFAEQWGGNLLAVA